MQKNKSHRRRLWVGGRVKWGLPQGNGTTEKGRRQGWAPKHNKERKLTGGLNGGGTKAVEMN